MLPILKVKQPGISLGLWHQWVMTPLPDAPNSNSLPHIQPLQLKVTKHYPLAPM